MIIKSKIGNAESSLNCKFPHLVIKGWQKQKCITPYIYFSTNLFPEGNTGNLLLNVTHNKSTFTEVLQKHLQYRKWQFFHMSEIIYLTS